MQGREPFREASFAGIDFLTASNQANHDTPILVAVHDADKKCRFRHIEVRKTLLARHEIGEMISSLLMGHALDGVSKKYISKIIITSGPALRSEQARISRRIIQLLGLSSAEFMAELAKSPLPAPPRERKPTKPRGLRKRENRSEYFKTWYAKNQAKIIEKRRAERAALKLHHDAPLVPDAPNRVDAARKKTKATAPAR